MATSSPGFISVFDMLKIGVGPSSSHTLGPWRAALHFIHLLKKEDALSQVKALDVELFGSLAKTGKGHGTDIAMILGLSGEDPVSIDSREIAGKIDKVNTLHKLNLNATYSIDFDPASNIRFLTADTPLLHPNTLRLIARINPGKTIEATYFSLGGGFIECVGETQTSDNKEAQGFPYPIEKTADLIAYCSNRNCSISDLVLANENFLRPEKETFDYLAQIWAVMRQSIYEGCHTQGILPGGLNVVRRAAVIHRSLIGEAPYNNYEEWQAVLSGKTYSFADTIKWVSCFAMAVNEVNASFGKIVTAPTNGAAGVIPAVLQYYITFHQVQDPKAIARFLMTASEIGSIFKKGATISAAMGGCQAEIGVSSAMAAAALTEALGGDYRQALMAAEIAMEHHLGLTCDPIGGLVQIPCIERNSMGAIKAITACQLALSGNPADAKVSLDNVVATMWETAKDLNHKYKETSEGGLAINVSINLSEC